MQTATQADNAAFRSATASNQADYMSAQERSTRTGMEFQNAAMDKQFTHDFRMQILRGNQAQRQIALQNSFSEPNPVPWWQRMTETPGQKSPPVNEALPNPFRRMNPNQASHYMYENFPN